MFDGRPPPGEVGCILFVVFLGFIVGILATTAVLVIHRSL